MKLTDKSCPRKIDGEVVLDAESCPIDTGALIVVRAWNRSRQRPTLVRLTVDDWCLRQLSDLVAKTAKAREDRAAYLRGGR